MRAAGVADIDAILRLLSEVAAENRWIRTQLPFDVLLRRERMRDGFATGNVLAFIAECDGMPAGSLTLRLRDGRGAVGMMVAQSQRRRGIGRRLMAAVIAAARARNLAAIDLEVYEHNAAAIALYRSLGFIESGPAEVEERSDGQRWHAIPMSKVL